MALGDTTSSAGMLGWMTLDDTASSAGMLGWMALGDTTSSAGILGGWLWVIQCKPDISRSCISRNRIYRGRMLDPFFWRPRTRYFSRNRGNSIFREICSPRSPLFSVRGRIFRETNSGLPVNAGWNTCCVVVSHARRSIDTSIVSQSRVQLIQCQCKSRLQIANLDINNAFFNQIHAVYIRHFVQTSGQFRSESRACDW